MAASVNDLIQEAREILQDLDPTNYRYPQQSLVQYYNGAIREARRLRPDLFTGTFQSQLPTLLWNPTLDLTFVPFALPEWLYVPTVNFIVGRAEIADDEFAVDGRAMSFLQNFVETLVGGA